jgi:macrophage erythroblast attacher
MKKEEIIKEIELENSFIKPSYELLNVKFRKGQKNIEKEFTLIDKVLKDQNNKKNLGNEETSLFLEKIIKRLTGMKRKIDEMDIEQGDQIENCLKRIEHLNDFKDISLDDEIKIKKWKEQRLNRIIVDYLNRESILFLIFFLK